MREAIRKTVTGSQALIQSAGRYFPKWGTREKNRLKFISKVTVFKNQGGGEVQRIILFSNFILKYKQDSLRLCQQNSMYFCFQIPNMKVINIRLETADIWSKLTAHKENCFKIISYTKQAIPKYRALEYKAYKRVLQLPKSQRPKKILAIFFKNNALKQNTSLNYMKQPGQDSDAKSQLRWGWKNIWIQPS